MTLRPGMIGLVAALVALLTFLLWKGTGPSGEDYVFAQRDVARVSLAEADLRADVLETRAGLLRDYDQLNHDASVLYDAAIELRGQARIQPSDDVLLDSMVRQVEADQVALERFKTDNALLQNSLAYFDVLDSWLASSTGDAQTTAAVAALGNAVLHLEADPSGQGTAQVKARLEALAERTSGLPAGLVHNQLKLLLAHGRVLVSLIPGVDRDLGNLFAIRTYDLRQAIRTSQDRRRRLEETHAERYRLALYLVAVLLSAVLARVGLQWRAGLVLLRQRAEVERIIAEISTSLVAMPIERHEAMMESILGRLAAAFGADRAYLVLEESADALSHRWSRPGLAWPPGWPRSLLEALPNDGTDAPLEAASLRAAAHDASGQALRAAGTRAWSGVVLRRAGRRLGLLGFDLVRVASPWPRGGAGLVRMAGEVIQSALDRQAAALERRTFEERLAHARRLEAVGAFASGIAHNFNNVVSAVVGHAEMAAETVGAGSATEHHIREISRAAERAQDLVAAILEFATRRAAEKRPVDLEALMSETAAMLQVLIPENVSFVSHVAASGISLLGNAAQLQQVLVNLVRNGCQAMPSGGRVVVAAETETVSAERTLSHDLLSPGEYVRLTVSDTGTGMSDKVLARIFEPFFTSRPAGTGLGLATVREIVYDHGGAIDVRSTPGRGSLFTVWLSMSRAGPAAETMKTGRGETILVLVSDSSDLVPEEDMVAALGYEPVGFTDIEAALQTARRAPERFSALILGATLLPDPLAVVRAFRDAGVARPAILVMDGVMDTDVATIAALDVIAVLPRPLRPPVVAEALGQACAAA